MNKHIQSLIRLLFILFLFITCSKDDPIQYSLSVNVTPLEGGTVSPNTGNFDEGVNKTITAIPSTEYVFKNWLGGASGTANPTTVLMTSDKTITAVFEKKMYAFNVLYEGEGNVSTEVDGINSNGTISSGSTVQLTAIPIEGWEFVSWGGDITSVENPITLTVDEAKNITAIFQPILYNQILGKWDLDNSNLLGKKNSSEIREKSNEKECILYSIVFNSDGSFILSLSSEEIHGTFYFDSSNSIVLNDKGKFDNIHINNNVLNFHLNLNNLCSLDGDAENDDDYNEGDCVSFLNCYDGNIWVKETETGFKYIRVRNNLSETWIEQYSFNTSWECTSESLTNLTSKYSMILVENNIEQMTFVLDDTPNGDVQVQLFITADNHLSVDYDYIDDSLNETDYYEVSTEESLNGYLNTYENCPERTYVPDNKFEQSLIYLGYDDVLDDYVITNQISAVEELNISVNNDLTGIEDFTNLIDFSISSENLTVLNLSGNVLLEQLRIYAMKLNSINITQNIQLKSLTSWGEPLDLTSIDISNNKLLTTLDLISPLSSIDIFHNTLLTDLSLSCQLTNLDVSQNTALTSLNCSGNQLTSLDISQNTALTSLYCSYNQIASLDISQNTTLINMQSNENQLICIQVNENQLSAIPSGWSKDATTSYSLNCSNSNAGKTYVPDNTFEKYLINMGYDDVLDDYVLTSNIAGVQELDLTDSQWFAAIDYTNPTWGASELTGIEDFLGLKILKLYANFFNIDTINFNTNTQLETLIIYEGPDLTSIDVSNNTKLKVLHIDGSQITSLDVSKNIHLESLSLFSTQLISLDVSNNTVLTTLDLRYNNSLTCIQVNQTQISNIPSGWSKDAGGSYSLDCSAHQSHIVEFTTGTLQSWVSVSLTTILTFEDGTQSTINSNFNYTENIVRVEIPINTASFELEFYIEDSSQAEMNFYGSVDNVTIHQETFNQQIFQYQYSF